MAASSGGDEWSYIIKKIFPSGSETCNKSELLELCLKIVKNEGEILQFKEGNNVFYNSLAALSADYIGSNANNLSFSHLEIVTAACRVLLKFFIGILQTVSCEGRSNVGQTERCLKAIRALCFGIGILTTIEFTVLTNAMKGETAPAHSTPSGSESDVNTKQESSKSKSDLSVSIFKQLTLPLRDGHTSATESPANGQVSVAEIANSNDPSTEIHKLFKTTNTETLQQLRAGDTLADLCLSLPTIKRARSKVDDALAGKPFNLPISYAEATTVRNSLLSMVVDIELAKSAIHLPVLEPLTPSKLDKLCNLSMAALYCAISQAAASSILSLGTAVSPKCTSAQLQAAKEEDLDTNAVVLVEEALNIHTFIGTIIKNSTRAGGHVFQNHLLAGSWVLISGLQTLITHRTSLSEETHTRERDDKGRSPSKSRESGSGRSVHIKFQQSFGVLSVALASRTLTLLSELFDDLHLEVCGGGTTVQVEPAPLAIMGQFSALQRVARLLGAAPLNQLLFYLATISYRKASTLKRVHPPEGDTFSQSDSTTYYEDMILCSDESSTEDDDSEPILGQWFEETLAPPEATETKSSPNTENGEVKSTQPERINSIVPEKGEPHGYISLCTQIFLFMNRHFLCSKSAYVTRYVKAGLTEPQMLILAAIIKDLDKETARTEVGTISVYFGAALGVLYCEFSSALTRYTHNLVTHAGLNTLQTSLLSHLGISPWNTDIPHAWPLQVYSRTLAVLAQVLLLRTPNEKEASVISIWHRLVNTLIESVINPPTVVDSENEDLNVEHAQVLLYLFHSLNLMQKKSVVLLMAGGVLRCSEVARGPLRDSQLIHLSRLLLLFDYIMKHLYDAPPILLEQIQWNLFYSTNLNADKDKENNMSRMYTPWREIEDNYRKISGNEEFSMKPRFYIITNMEMNNQDASKLDGLACNFILGTPDKLKYPLLLDALIEILNVTHITSGTGSLKMTYLGLCATQYCFTICWRLLQLLPPSAPYMQKLASNETLAAGPVLLHSLIWGPRTGHKNFNRWLKDALVKQGLYTQHTEKLLKTVTETVGTLKYDITTAKNSIVALTPDIKKGTISKESLPPLWHLFLLDSVLAKVQISLIDETETNTADASGVTVSGATYVQDLLPHILRLTQAILHCLRWSLLHCMVQQSEPSGKFTLQDFEGLQEVLAIASSRNILTNALATELCSFLPTVASTAIQQWNVSTLEDCSWAPYLNDITPSENYILKIIDIHISTLSMAFPFSINMSLKRLLQCLIKFICQYAPKTENTDTKNRAIELLVSITLDLRTEFLHDSVSKTLDKMIGDTETDEHQKRVYLHFLENSYKLIINHTSSATSNVAIDEKMLHSCLKFYEKILEKSSGRQALECFFTGERDLVKVLMSVSSPQMSQQYSTRVLHLFNKLFQTAEKSTTDPSLNYLCSNMSKLANVESDKLQVWLRHVILGPNNMSNSSSSSNVQTPTLVVPSSSKPEGTPSRNTPKPTDGTVWNASSDSNPSPSPSDDQKLLVQENSQLLQALTSYIVRQGSNVSEDVALIILKALLPVGSHILSPALEGAGFTELMVVMTMLADAGIGKGHCHLFPAVVDWLDMCKHYISRKENVDKLTIDSVENTRNIVMLDATCCLLDYVSDLVSSLTSQAQGIGLRAFSPPWEGEAPVDMENDFPDELNDEDDSGNESDEDALCNKLCTFTVTQKEFMNQHWYHCHTCRMLDGVGVCSVCARVCHKGHEVTYAKCGNFFCDCGAKEDASCLALVKRSPQTATDRDIAVALCNNVPLGYSSENMLTSSLRRRTSSPIALDRNNLFKSKKTGNIVKQIEGSREWLFNYFGSCTIPGTLIELLQALIPAVDASCGHTSPIGCHARALKALHELQTTDKKYINSDNLMSVSVSSQEGAFENVRMSYAGEQGQTIRQLLSAHIVRRMTMACLSSPHGKKQHLVVAHEKGKVTVLQLAALLRQGDAVLKKLALTKLASAPIPFTVLTLASNPCNDEFLAVCGLKDCHVLIFSSTGSVTERIVLHPQLETGNFIIKAVWLPGSQTELALITADFVKIYDLSKDALSPLYYFLVPSGKIRDCTFVYEYGIYNILLMSSPGHIYTEVLNEESSAKHGSFYVTNTLEVFNIDVTDVSGQVAGGGVSIYYSHTLGLLFYSYAQGKSFISPFTSRSNCLTMVFPITLSSAASSSGSKSNGGKSPTPQPLCQWAEIPNHPGLVYCTLQSSNNPVVILLKPDSVSVQEIKIIPTKSKITDVVGIRHISTNDARTTILLLCEDGTLKLYVALMEQTGYWLSPSIRPTVLPPPIRSRKKKVIKQGKSSNTFAFPTDFFEHCQPMNDVELGGNDLLQIYNAAQLKQRLNTTGTYAVCCKPLGFNLEITNSDNNMVMTGIRVLVGSQDPHRAPSFIEIFGRIVTISINRSRWFDLPFTREESLQADKKVTIMLGASQDPETITMIDSVKVYGKTKDNFGWPEENDESTNGTNIVPANATSSSVEADQAANNMPTLTTIEKLTIGILEILDYSFSLYLTEEKLTPHKPLSLFVATRLLTLPLPPSLQMYLKGFLAALHTTKQSYHSYKDHALLQHVHSSLLAMIEVDPTNFASMDAENYYRLVMVVRGIANSRPQNLVKFADSETSIQDVLLDDPLDVKIKTSKDPHILLQIMDVLWILHAQNPENPDLVPVVTPGLKHTEQIIHAVVEIVHAFNTCDAYSNITIAVYLQLLLCEDSLIAFSAKQAINRVLKPKCKRRRVFIPSPPHCGSPPGKSSADVEKDKPRATPQLSQEDDRQSRNSRYDIDSVESIGLLEQAGASSENHNINMNPLEALLGGGAGFPPILDIPPDADDETMVELAIALSLQEHELSGGIPQGQQGLHGLQVAVGQAHQEAGHYSDTTVSAAGSDDEGSTAATDGSTLRTSPAEQGGSAGSESGGSGVDSITGEHNVSGRSSAYGDNIQEAITLVSRSDTSSVANANFQAVETDNLAPEVDPEQESETSSRLHMLRLQLLERLIEYLPRLKYVDGVRAIPFLQVVLQLTSDLDGKSERDKNCLNNLLMVLTSELQLSRPFTEEISRRTSVREVQLVFMRLLNSILLSRSKSSFSKSSSNDSAVFVSQTTATFLYKADVIGYCLKLLQSLLDYWNRNPHIEEDVPVLGEILLKKRLPRNSPDISPFFAKHYMKANSTDIFDGYPELLTEMLLRLPYQVHKQSEISEPVTVAFDNTWFKILCEYMMASQPGFVRRQVRKLLMFICGNKEKYRQLRDVHALNTHMKAVRLSCTKGGFIPTAEVQHGLPLSYDTLVDLVEHLKACLEVAVLRTGNWQRFCIHNDDTLSFLLQVSCLLDEGVAPTILHLVQCAITNSGTAGIKKTETNSSNGKSSNTRKDREKSDDSAAEALFEEANCYVLIEKINKQISKDVLLHFIKTFLLETNATIIRMQAHTIIFAIYKNSTLVEQNSLLQLLWQLWPLLASYGRKASQFVDLLGYFFHRFAQNNRDSAIQQIGCYVAKAVEVLKLQNELLAHHPNTNLYMQMSQYVEIDGYYLESDPCLVCNNPEVSLSTLKLSSLKADSKFTTTTQIVKLIGCHTISKITIRIGDLKRTKMVRTINIYYNNRSVQAVVELKNKPALWHKAKKVGLLSGQTEVKVEFPLPIVACNLMIEYADFYENIHANSETLQCPRCSAAVPSNPGVCANCGENVFQCHKCRAINYDEKDPFLCHACGFCKYAKFDFSLLARPCCAVEPIETEDDRKKMVSSINNLLERADRIYKQLMANKPVLESLIMKVTEPRVDRKEENGQGNSISTSNNLAPAPSGAQIKVNKTIQMLAQQYCGDCKTSFEELSKIIQRVLVSRKELVAYDRKHRDAEVPTNSSTSSLVNSQPSTSKDRDFPMSQTVNTNIRCYGCCSAASEHCLTLLRTLAMNTTTRQVLCSKGLVQELVWNNLRKGTVQMQEEVRKLLRILATDNFDVTEELCTILTERIMLSLNGRANSYDFITGIHHEITLLGVLVQKEDKCWELKLRFLFRVFLKACDNSQNPLVMDSVILPCLEIMLNVIKPKEGVSKKAKDKTNATITRCKLANNMIDTHQWLKQEVTFSMWLKSTPRRLDDSQREIPKDREILHSFYLSEKYGQRWRNKVRNCRTIRIINFNNTAWIKAVLFSPSSRSARQVACSIIEFMCIDGERRRDFLILLTRFLKELTSSGESAAEFLGLFQSLIHDPPWKQYLTLHGILIDLADLVTKEIEQLHLLEETTLTSDLTQGYALFHLIELLASFLEDPAIRRQYKSRLVGAVLNGYLSLRRLVVQRTRLIDDTQEKLLDLLEEMTSGTEEETKAFMAVCIQTIEKYSTQDVLTPVFIFERLCSIIYPEENDVGEFFLTLEKDSQQEDFLQGRMLGNPYSSLESGLGPLMRDVKNKICQDCELVALLEDDNGMELLVNNKIMSLDLPVKDVYKKVWLQEGGEADAMRIVYRMRGLLGDATEEFVEKLSNKTQSTVNNEEVYKMANVLADCGGLQIMVSRLGAIPNIWRARPLLQVLLKLFQLSVKVQVVQEVLIQPQVEAMEVFLRTLQACFDGECDSNQAALTEQLLDIIETILAKATSKSIESFKLFSKTFGGPEYISSLLSCTNHTSVRNNQPLLEHLTRVLAALVYGNREKMRILLLHFAPVTNFNKYDFEHTQDDQQKLEMFCVLTDGIEKNAIGNTLKDYIIKLDIVKDAVEYITMHAPCVKPTLLRVDSDELKEFISKPALKYILRFLTGLATNHEKTQLAIAAADTIPIIHRLEQVSSDEHVGSLAENLLEALRINHAVAARIEEAREFTRSEKKRLAMAMREKQLGQLGMHTNDKGQVTAKSSILQQMEELGEETGLVCCICREGYKYQPTKVLGIYTFTKRCNVEEYESKPRKTIGYNTVTHFNVIHVDCHMSAVRLARARDEWESAALQNANTKCNGLLPLWGPQVPESAFASCLARHNTYLQECTNHRNIGHNSTIQDIKLVLLRFAQEKSFHDDTGGGGPQSNMHLIPYLIHMTLYVINTTRVSKREEASLISYLENTNYDKWVESAYEAEGPLYWLVLSIMVHSRQTWLKHKIAHLRRLLVLAQARHVTPSGPCKTISDKTVKEYSVYKPYLVLFGLIDGVYYYFFKNVNGTDEQWSNNLADYIRHNDEAMVKASERLLDFYTDELLPCSCFLEFCDVAGLLNDISQPDEYLKDLLNGMS